MTRDKVEAGNARAGKPPVAPGGADADKEYTYRVVSINSVGLESEAAEFRLNRADR